MIARAIRSVASAVAAQIAHRHARTILIDGPSGSGKSDFAMALRTAIRRDHPEIVRMDSLYPGWNGLAAGSAHIVSRILIPRAAGRAGRWQEWDWDESRGGRWLTFPVKHTLIVEGCGSLTRSSRQLVDLAIWVEADGSLRKSRALARDAGMFDPFWDAWENQWEEFQTRHRGIRVADIRLWSSADRMGIE